MASRPCEPGCRCGLHSPKPGTRGLKNTLAPGQMKEPPPLIRWGLYRWNTSWRHRTRWHVFERHEGSAAGSALCGVLIPGHRMREGEFYSGGTVTTLITPGMWVEETYYDSRDLVKAGLTLADIVGPGLEDYESGVVGALGVTVYPAPVCRVCLHEVGKVNAEAWAKAGKEQAEAYFAAVKAGRVAPLK